MTASEAIAPLSERPRASVRRTRIWRQTATGYSPLVQFEKVWIERCRATEAIKRRFGAKSALDYLIGEKLITFANATRGDPAARELPRFLAVVWQAFNQYEIAGYVASRRPVVKNRLRQLLYLR